MNSGILLMVLLLLVLFFILRSCVFSPNPEQITKSTNTHTVFVVLAPINKEQLNLAISFVRNAESNLMVRDNYYELKGICNGELEYIESLHYSSVSSPKILFNSLLNWLGKTQNQICDSSATESLKSVINRINDYLNQNKQNHLIAFIQIPWKKGFSSKEYDELTLEVSKVKDKTRVEKIYLFGVTDGNISNVFRLFNLTTPETVITSGTDPGNIRNLIREARELIRSSK
ncbi:hypothetical protein [Aerosakkonema sp. BLCC-F183]|uniref:hypothetical protein n=1 Tax=Aerosakkonema sp. BLCC-F183 TaxID=3342834 RepID=UPI0035BBB0EF